MSFWGELKRRNVVRVGIAYVVAAWLIIQVAETLFSVLELPTWTTRFVAALLVLGFPLALILSWAYELTPEGLKRSGDVTPSESITQATGRRIDRVIIAVLAVAVVFLVLDNYLLRESSTESIADGASASAPASQTEAAATETAVDSRGADVVPNSIAVLPLTNLSPNPDDAYFAAGLHDEILNQLAKLRALNVIARTSVLRYAAGDRSIPEIASELNVATVMEGTVRFANDRIRVTTQLIDAGTGLHLWSETYDREFDDIFAIESDIAMNVANAMQAEFSPQEQQTIYAPPTTSTAAYGLYLQAQSMIGTSGLAGREALLERALELDPEFSLALGAMASNHIARLINTTANATGTQVELEPLIREYVERAFDVDPEDGSTHAAMGALAAFTWRWTEALRSVRRALESPTLSDPSINWALSWFGRHEESLQSAERLELLNPVDWLSPWSRGIVLNYAGRYDDAASALARARAIAPEAPVVHAWIAYTEIARGNNDRAARELELLEQLIGDDRQILCLLDMAYGYSRLDDRNNAQRLYDEIRALAAGQEIGAGGRAITSLAIGDYDEALRWLDVAAGKASRHELDAGMFNLMNLKLNYMADPVLERPEFVDVRNRLVGD